MKELEKFKCVLSVITITPILTIDEKTMGAMEIILVINDGVYVCICKVYSSDFKAYTKHEFIYDSAFS